MLEASPSLGLLAVAEAMTADMQHGLVWPSGHKPFQPVQSACSGERSMQCSSALHPPKPAMTQWALLPPSDPLTNPARFGYTLIKTFL